LKSLDFILHKNLNLAASAVLLLWIGFIITGVFAVGASFYLWKTSIILFFYENPIIAGSILIMILSSRYIYISVADLRKNRKWTNPSKFIKNILMQVTTAIIASILAIVFKSPNYFTDNLFLDFFMLFTIFTLVISIGFIAYWIYYFSIDIYGSERYKWENYDRKFI
jgi:hypothetical protein